MKIKCPVCGGYVMTTEHWNVRPWCCFCINEKCRYDIVLHAYTKIGAQLRYNRWARREKRRMEKEGANQ